MTRVAAVWGDTQRGEAALAFAATELPYADYAWRSASARIDAWADAWVDAATEACAATQLRHELSPAIMDLRVACLDRRLQHLDALAKLLQRADKDVVRRAVDAAAELPDLAECADLVALQADVTPPPPTIADRVAAARAEIAAAEALDRGGKDSDAVALLEAQRPAIEALAYRPLAAEFLMALSSAQGGQGADEEALKSARSGLWTAIAAGDDPRARDLLGQLIWISGYKLGRSDEARGWIDHAEAMVLRDGDRPAARASLLSKIGQVEIAAGHFPEAEAALTESIALYEASGADALKLLNPLNALSMARLRGGRYAEALPPVERALAIATAARGPSHPDLAGLLNSLALIHERHGRYPEAIDAMRRTLAIIEATSGPEHPNAGLIRQNLGGLLLLSGRRDEAEVEIRAGLAILVASLGDDHPATAGARTFLGDALRERGDLEGARAEYERALEIRRAALGDEHHDLALPLLGLGQVALAGAGAPTRSAIPSARRRSSPRPRRIPATSGSSA
ncbi:MAG: tetratricopeptide repeat protein [Myxococcales bacterium]|nr:tetratricopeptide repeat protein [Myxococcales bacterium]